MKPRIILVAGKKQSGKDTTAEYISTKHDYTKLYFAEELKEMSYHILKLLGVRGITVKDFESEEFKKQIIPYKLNKNKRTYRELLQQVGTEWFRNFFNESLWAEMLVEEIKTFIPGSNIVISDFRFQNEYQTVYEAFKDTHDIITLRIQRDSCDTTDSHISEKALDDFMFDYVLTNNGTKEELYDGVDKLFEEKIF